MHPAHVPLECKAKTAVFGSCGNLRPCRGFLCDGAYTGIGASDNGIHMLEKFNRLEVFIAAVLVGNPCSVLFSVIKVKHACNCIHAESVDMELSYPEKCIGN